MKVTYQGEVTSHVKSSNTEGVKSGIEFQDGDSKYSTRTMYVAGEYPIGTRFDVILTNEVDEEPVGEPVGESHTETTVGY